MLECSEISDNRSIFTIFLTVLYVAKCVVTERDMQIHAKFVLLRESATVNIFALRYRFGQKPTKSFDRTYT